MSKSLTLDKYGVVGQIQDDGSIEGGDSACWQGHRVYLTKVNDPNYVDFFEVGFGAYVRHPDPKLTIQGFGAHYKNPWNGCISRDQLTGILMAIVGTGDRKAMLRLMLHHACWGMLFSYNTIRNGRDPATARWKLPDLTLMDIWATQLRGFGKVSWLFFPLLCVLDLQMLLNAIMDRVLKVQDDDVINFMGKLFVSREHVPTPVSWLTLKVLDADQATDRLERYWCGWRQNPGMYFLFLFKMKELGL